MNVQLGRQYNLIPLKPLLLAQQQQFLSRTCLRGTYESHFAFNKLRSDVPVHLLPPARSWPGKYVHPQVSYLPIMLPPHLRAQCLNACRIWFIVPLTLSGLCILDFPTTISVFLSLAIWEHCKYLESYGDANCWFAFAGFVNVTSKR